MRNNKSFAIIFTIIMIVIFALVIYIILSSNEDLSISNNSGLSNNTSGYTNGTLSVSDSYENYFDINALLNTYYDYVHENDKTALLNVLDSSYVTNNKITKDNLNDFIKNTSYYITFVAKDVYYKQNNNTVYYFASGEEHIYDFDAEVLTEKENVKYLIIVDKNKTFSIIPLDTLSLSEYAKNYQMLNGKKIKSNANNAFKTDKYSDENIVKYYLNYYQTLLYLNTEKAYSMLDSTYKSHFVDFEDFNKNLERLYSLFSTNFLRYSVNGNNGKRSYSIMTLSDKRIDVYESSIMNFTVRVYE